MRKNCPTKKPTFINRSSEYGVILLPCGIKLVNLQGFNLGISALCEDFERFRIVGKNHSDRHINPAVIAEYFNRSSIYEQFEVNPAVYRLQGCLISPAGQFLLFYIIRDRNVPDYKTRFLCLVNTQLSSNVNKFSRKARKQVISRL